MKTIKLNSKALVYTLATVAFASCNNNTLVPPRGQVQFTQPVTIPLKFSTEKTFDLDKLPSMPVAPLVKKINLARLPTEPYDTSGFRTFSSPINTSRFDYKALPEKDLDIDKLPSKPLRFKTFLLAPPKLIRAGLPQLINPALSLYGFGESQGLQGNVITCLLNDRDGFLWIATDQGLYRYDGENLTQYTSLPLSIYSMLQDSAGSIWIGTEFYGIFKFTPRTGLLKRLTMDRGIGSDDIGRMLLDDHNRIWATMTGGGVMIIDPQTETFRLINIAQGLSNSAPFGITQDTKENIWVGYYGGGLNVIDLAGKKIRYITEKQGLKGWGVSSLICDKKGRIWVAPALNVGMNVIDPVRGTIRYIKEAGNLKTGVWTLAGDNKGQVWAGTSNDGVKIINIDNQTVENIRAVSPHNEFSAARGAEFIENICRDSHGQTWIATRGGLNVLKQSPVFVKHIGATATGAMMEEKNGLIWQGSFFNGVNILDTKNKQVKYFTHAQGFCNDTIEMIRNVKGGVSLCTVNGLDIIDSTKTTITHFGRKQGFSSKQINAMTIDPAGRVWICGGGGVVGFGIDVYYPAANSIKHIGIKQGLSDEDISDINIDSGGNIWISTWNGGINEIDGDTGTIKHLTSPAGLSDKAAKVLLPGSNGDMWIGTDKGIYIANVKKNTLTSISIPQGLIDDAVISLLSHKGRIYAGTNKGISVITPNVPGADKKWHIESFGISYGIKKVNVGSFATDAITRDGLYWWGDDGLTVFDLSKKDISAPAVFLTGINVMDQPEHFVDKSAFGIKANDTIWINRTKPYTKGRIPANTGYALQDGFNWDGVAGPYNLPTNLQLPYDHNYLRFNYSAINLTTRDTARYSYFLSGADKKWSETTTTLSSRNYFNLPPGKYTFQVVSKTSENAWSPPATFTFIITPPWWQTWWAYIIYVLLFGSSVWVFAHFRSLSLIREKRTLEHKIHLRTEEVMQQKEEIEAQRDELSKTVDNLKTTQRQLIQSEKMASLGELTAGIAHEIQNPLNFVNNFSEVNREMIDELKAELKGGNLDEALAIADDIGQNEDKINHHGKRADSIVKGMLEHSRSRTGQKEPTDINTMADEFLRLAFQGLRAKDKSFNSELLTRFDPALPKINVVQQDIGRVFLNLFNNAFYAVNQKQKIADAGYKPEVSVATSVEDDHVIIKVKDNGTGIPDAIKDKIMQPFFTTKPTGEGTGLGLSLTYDMVVKGHGGKIEVNTKEGEFTEFIIQLDSK